MCGNDFYCSQSLPFPWGHSHSQPFLWEHFISIPIPISIHGCFRNNLQRKSPYKTGNVEHEIMSLRMEWVETVFSVSQSFLALLLSSTQQESKHSQSVICGIGTLPTPILRGSHSHAHSNTIPIPMHTSTPNTDCYYSVNAVVCCRSIYEVVTPTVCDYGRPLWTHSRRLQRVVIFSNAL